MKAGILKELNSKKNYWTSVSLSKEMNVFHLAFKQTTKGGELEIKKLSKLTQVGSQEQFPKLEDGIVAERI